MKNKTEWECIDLRCTHFDGDMCLRGVCDPDLPKGLERVTTGDPEWDAHIAHLYDLYGGLSEE